MNACVFERDRNRKKTRWCADGVMIISNGNLELATYSMNVRIYFNDFNCAQIPQKHRNNNKTIILEIFNKRRANVDEKVIKKKKKKLATATTTTQHVQINSNNNNNGNYARHERNNPIMDGISSC